jgi:hypothetical protein
MEFVLSRGEKMSAPDFIQNHIPDSAQLTLVRETAQQLRDLELRIQTLEQALEEAQSAAHTMRFETLPDLMDQAGVDRVGLPQAGNLPACDLQLTPFYVANIAAAWPEEKRASAFLALAELGHEDLIKTEITVQLPRNERRQAQRIIAALENFSVPVRIKESVHPQTLTAWLKEQFERHNPLPPLEVIGATIGRIARLKERK